MIGHNIMIAVFQMSLHSTIAVSTFESDERHIADFLLQEKPIEDYSCDSISRDIVCNELQPWQKQLLCDQMMEHMIRDKEDELFESESFEITAHSIPAPKLARDFIPYPYRCEEVLIQNLFFMKRMFWCKPRRYRKASGNYGEMEGFFCAGSLVSSGTIFAFRPIDMDAIAVKPVGKMYDPDSDGIY